VNVGTKVWWQTLDDHMLPDVEFGVIKKIADGGDTVLITRDRSFVKRGGVEVVDRKTSHLNLSHEEAVNAAINLCRQRASKLNAKAKRLSKRLASKGGAR